jgi:hypothetical protein
MRTSRRFARPLAVIGALLAWLALGTGAAPIARAACQHGVSTFKTCDSPRRSCATNADCDDGLQCTDDVCDVFGLSNVTDCLITLTNADTCGDTTKIVEAFDVQDLGGDNVRVPAVGNLPIDAINGNAVCCAGPVLPCFVAPAGAVGVISNAASGCGNLPLPGVATTGSVEFRQNTYVIQPNDPNPLPDQGTFKAQDLCNAGASGCSMGINTVQFTAATDLVPGCIFPPTQDSTPCGDVDNNLCTTAGCDGAGSCDQDHIVTTCPGDACAGQCEPSSGLCVPVQDSSPCPDTDNNPCTISGCQAGFCDQNHILPDSTPCPDTANECASAGCDGAGNCDQNHVPEQDSTPCTDTDGIACTTAGCDGAGTCDQTHIDQCIPPLRHFQCYQTPRGAFPVINGVSVVDQFGPSTVRVIRPKRLCNPANKNGEDPTAPDDINHLAGYVIKQTSPPPQRVGNIQVTNQFGTLVLEIAKAEYLLVPTAKSLTGPPGPLPSRVVDHFKCYKIHGAKQRVSGLTIVDQFGTIGLDILKPLRLCAPADKNGEGILDPNTHLLCYKIRQTSVPFFRGINPVFIDNQFQVTQTEVDHLRELCVPSTKIILP